MLVLPEDLQTQNHRKHYDHRDRPGLMTEQMFWYNHPRNDLPAKPTLPFSPAFPSLLSSRPPDLLFLVPERTTLYSPPSRPPSFRIPLSTSTFTDYRPRITSFALVCSSPFALSVVPRCFLSRSDGMARPVKHTAAKWKENRMISAPGDPLFDLRACLFRLFPLSSFFFPMAPSSALPGSLGEDLNWI